jgi:c-di-GMP-binding flagellar brake protein YcgR
VAITIKVPGLDPVNNLMSIVRDQSFADSVCRLGLEIVDGAPVRETMPRELFSMFSRRRYVRVDTLQEAPIPALVTWHDEKPPTKAHLANISASGCALLFALGCAPRVVELLLEFRLPGSTYGYHLKGKIRNVIDTDQMTSCGIEFDDDHSHDFLAQQSRITHFVENRQQEQVLELTNRFRALTIKR